MAWRVDYFDTKSNIWRVWKDGKKDTFTEASGLIKKAKNERYTCRFRITEIQ